MTALTNQKIQTSYGDLVQVSNSNLGIDATLRNLSSGLGNNAAFQVSTTSAQATGTFGSTGAVTFASTLGVTGMTTVQNITVNGTPTLATPLSPASGGTGAANNAANTLTFTGNFSLGVTLTGNTAITLPTSGTLITNAVTTLSSLVSIGTITTGTWTATTIGVPYGGTGQTSYTNGQLLIGNTTGNTLTKATLTASNNTTITNGTGSITVGTTVTLPLITKVVTQSFAANGTYTPTTGMKYCKVRMVGAGGGGAGIGSNGAGGASSGGGGAGEYREGTFTATDIGASQTITIGAAGAGGAAGNNAGATGGTTSLGALLTAVGGTGGGVGAYTSANTTGGTGGAGGTGGTGTGHTSMGAAGKIGLTMGAITTGLGGDGGPSQFGGGGGGGRWASDGTAAAGYGSGGGGASGTLNSTSHAGGNGTVGLIIIDEFVSS